MRLTHGRFPHLCTYVYISFFFVFPAVVPPGRWGISSPLACLRLSWCAASSGASGILCARSSLVGVRIALISILFARGSIARGWLPFTLQKSDVLLRTSIYVYVCDTRGVGVRMLLPGHRCTKPDVGPQRCNAPSKFDMDWS